MPHSNLNVSKKVLTQNRAAQLGMFCGAGEIRSKLDIDRDVENINKMCT